MVNYLLTGLYSSLLAGIKLILENHLWSAFRRTTEHVTLWLPVQYDLSESVSSASKLGMAEQNAWKLWETLAEIYGNRWLTKNGLQPSTLWIAQISGMTVEQLQATCSRLVQRCAEGNSWPPDLAEFVSLAAECSGGSLGLTGEDVTAEYKRWKSESWRYNSSEEFPWRHPVLYHICVEMRRECIQRKLSQPEMDKLAAVKLTRWEKKIAAGYLVPPIRRKIAASSSSSGPTPAQLMFEEFKRRKDAGLVK